MSELTKIMKLDNTQLERSLKMAERKMNEAKDIEVFEASMTLLEDLKIEQRRRHDA